jgi:hypothetical protein
MLFVCGGGASPAPWCPGALVSCGPGPCGQLSFWRRGSSGRRSSVGCVGKDGSGPLDGWVLVGVGGGAGAVPTVEWAEGARRVRGRSIFRPLVPRVRRAGRADVLDRAGSADVPNGARGFGPGVAPGPDSYPGSGEAGQVTRRVGWRGSTRRPESWVGSSSAGRPRLRRRRSGRLRRPGRARGRVRSPRR